MIKDAKILIKVKISPNNEPILSLLSEKKLILFEYMSKS